jgi:hypothetical protein
MGTATLADLLEMRLLDGRGMMTSRWWVAVPLMVGLALAGCGGDGDGPGATGVDADATGTVAADATGANDSKGANAGAGASAGVMMLGDEDIAVDGLRCFFGEQPRAGLGGAFTHTAQGRGTNAAGEDVVLDLSRARAEDGTVEDDIIVDIGDPSSDDSVSLTASGSEGLIQFGDDSASASGVEVSEFGAEPVALSFDLACR